MHDLPKLMGILNITPDSFSRDGTLDKHAIMQHLEQLLKDGADIIDIGAESTRPGATPLSAEQEWERLAPVLAGMIKHIHRSGKKVSVDTRHAATAAKSLQLGADIINDVSGVGSADMQQLLAAHHCQIVFMHSLSIPADKSQVLAAECDVIAELKQFAVKRTAELEAKGINRARLIFDPGIGFAKTPTQSLDILKRIDELKALGLPLLIGHSRKSFLNLVTDTPFAQRDALTLAVSHYLLQHDIDILRVHHIGLHRELFALTNALNT